MMTLCSVSNSGAGKPVLQSPSADSVVVQFFVGMFPACPRRFDRITITPVAINSRVALPMNTESLRRIVQILAKMRLFGQCAGHCTGRLCKTI